MIDSVIDPILDAIHRSATLTDDEKIKVAQIVANSGHEALRNYIYGIEDEPVGIEISYRGSVLNDQSFRMPDIAKELSFNEFSRYDEHGAPKADR